MPVLDQFVTTRWTNPNKIHYIEMGIPFTKIGDVFEVHISKVKEQANVMVWMKCEQCEETILKSMKNIRNRNVTCCSDVCRKKFDRVRIQMNCEICDSSFERTPSQKAKSKNHFCSKDCANKAERKDPTKYKMCTCEFCEEEYEIQISNYTKYPSRFCSVPCRNKWESKYNIGVNNKIFTSEIFQCTHCTKDVYRNQARIKEDGIYFCSNECRQSWYADVWSKTPEWRKECKIRSTKLLSDGFTGKTDTGCQLVVNEILDTLGVRYINEYNCKYVSIDNYLDDNDLMIEVMGTFWHCDPRSYDMIEYQNQVKRIKHDKIKNRYIRNNYKIEILYLWEEDIINNRQLCLQLIKNYVENGGLLPNYHSFNFETPNENIIRLKDKLIVPYSEYSKKVLNDIIKIKDTSQIVSMKQLDKWIQFNCQNCGEEKEQLISHYSKSLTHCCSVECGFELKKKNNLLKKII